MEKHSTAGPDIDYTARWHAVEALVTRARDKGVTRIDTDLLAEALGLDTSADEATEPDPDSVGPHNFEPQWMGESDAKRRLPKCSVCKQPATHAAHDGDQSLETRRLRMLLNA